MTNIVRDWTTWIVPRVNDNTKPDGKNGNKSFRTTDFISIKSLKEIKNQKSRYSQKSVTDFAIMNGATHYDYKTHAGKFIGTYYSRTGGSRVEVYSADMYNGDFIKRNVARVYSGFCPSLSLKLPSNISAEEFSREIGEVKEVKSQDGKILYHTLELGEYPKTRVSSDMQEELESMYNGGNLRGGLKCTGKLFTANNYPVIVDELFQTIENPEFELNGEKYVRVKAWYNHTRFPLEYEDGTKPEGAGDVQWVKVEPITFRIENYKEFSKGKAKTLELDSDEIILAGLTFYPNSHHDNSSMWQNSLIRAFMNSAKTSDMDGNPKYQAPIKFDFRNSGLLYQAFNMTRQPTRKYIISENENVVCYRAFSGCLGIEKIIIPSHVDRIDRCAFSGCLNSQVFINFQKGKSLRVYGGAFSETNFKFLYIAKDGSGLVLSPREDATLDDRYFKFGITQDDIIKFCEDVNYRENFVQLTRWKQEGAIKFIPPEYTIQTFPSGEMHKYFVNNNNQRWGRLVKTLGFDTLVGHEKNNSLIKLMKIYYAIGGFSANQGESENAFNYVLKYVATTRKPNETPSQIAQEIRNRFYSLNIRGPYNPTFAKFFMKYYHENPDFMCFNSSYGDMDYLCMAHNSFDKILEAYPYRGVTGNEERALITPKFVAEHLINLKYKHVDAGNESLAELICGYGYSQEEFEHIQKIYNKAKTIKNKYVISADKSEGTNGITFRVLAKDDPLGFILGDITNCCQHVGGAAESCVDDGYINPNAGFLVFEESELDKNGKSTGETRILGQAYVWYDPMTKTVCYDNIEIPHKVLDKLNHGDKHGEKLSSKALMDSVVESADAIMLAMNKRGINVTRVTTGRGYNDLGQQLNDRFGAPEKDPKSRHRGYHGYSDAKDEQYVVRTYDETTKKYVHNICETAATIRADLGDLKKIGSKINKVKWDVWWKI